jgi:glycosyltransferase involved in cell wall biosynthesis
MAPDDVAGPRGAESFIDVSDTTVIEAGVIEAGLTPRSREGKLLSIVVPMHNEAEVLGAFFDRMEASLATLGVAFEIICVDDGSRDATLTGLIERARKDSQVKVIALARNFGKEAALTAGIEAARGDMVTPIDADLQDPPELIGEFVRLWEAGYDVIYGSRADRSSDTAMKRTTARLFYRIFNRVSDLDIPESAGDFRLMDRQVVEALKLLPERNRFMKGLFAWVGFRQIGVPYARPERAAGNTSMGYPRLFRFALDGITSFSTAPLRVWSVVGVGSAVLAVIAAIGLVVRVLIVGREVPGYASLMVVILLGFAVQMLAFGVLGEYVGRLYQEVKGRPIYVVRARIGFDG